MSNNQVFSYNGSQITFQLDGSDIMINATEMAKFFGKRPNDYLTLSTTNQLINAITRKYGIADNQIVAIERGGLCPGTWLHRLIALDFAQWLSIDLKLWCTERIDELFRYGMTGTQTTLDNILSDPASAIKLLQALQEERQEKERLSEQNSLNIQQLKLSAPKVQYYDTVLQSKSTYNTNQIAKELGMSAETLNKKLRDRGVQYKQNGQWLDKGYTGTKTHTYTRSDGEVGTSMLTVWTEKGREFIRATIAN